MKQYEVTAYAKRFDISYTYRVQALNESDAYDAAYNEALDNAVHLDTMEIDIEQIGE